MVATIGRTRRYTAQGLNAKLRAAAEARVAYYAEHLEDIEQRLRELDQEWDIDRAIELEAAGTVLTGVVLGMTVSKKWLLLSAFASAMVLLRNLHGEYPLLPLFRRLGFRTAFEIDQERYALKALRGDFAAIAQSGDEQHTHAAFEAARPTAHVPQTASAT